MEDHERELGYAKAMLPAWFVERMMTDEWPFGLLLDTGVTLAITHIDQLHRGDCGALWIDARMMAKRPELSDQTRLPIMVAPTSRLNVSIRVDHIVAAFELAD